MMEWKIKYEPKTRQKPWSVYKAFNDIHVFKKGFDTEDEARDWVYMKEKNASRPQGEHMHKVDEASMQSFPASDPPAWTKMKVDKKEKQHGTRE